MGVAEDNLGTHVDELVDEEQAALEHLLVEQHGATSLGGYHDEHAEEVGGQSRPRCISQRHDGTVDKRVYHVVLLTWDIEVVALHLYADTQSAECLRNDAQVFDGHILDADAVATHGCHSDERADLNHVGQHLMFGAV